MKGRFLRLDLAVAGRRAEGPPAIAAGDRAADETEHGGSLGWVEGRESKRS